MADSSIRVRPIVGTTQRRSTALAKKSRAQMTAMTARITLAFTVAVAAVKLMPVKIGVLATSSPYWSNQ